MSNGHPTMSAIYTEAQVLARSLFTGDEEHFVFRSKIRRLSSVERALLEQGVLAVTDRNLSISEVIYWLLNDLMISPQSVCKTCNEQFILRKYKSLRDGYIVNDFCSAGCRSRNKSFSDRIAKTNLERYGHSNNMWGSAREKTKSMWLEKYGVDNPIKSGVIKTKIKETNLKNLGVEWPAQSPIVRAKYKSTMLANHGVDHSFKTGNSQITCHLRYGVDNPMQHPPIFEKTQRYKRKTGIMPSGKTYSYQGFENVGIDALLENYAEEQIIIGNVEKIPTIEYWNPTKQRLCVYFPDIFISSQNLLIEIKSSYTMKAQLEENLAKHEAAKRLGFRHEVWICTAKKIVEIML